MIRYAALLAGALAVLGASYWIGRTQGTAACEARHEDERRQTQDELFRLADKLSDRERELVTTRETLTTRLEEFEDEVRRLDLCRATPAELQRLRNLWTTAP